MTQADWGFTDDFTIEINLDVEEVKNLTISVPSTANYVIIDLSPYALGK